MYKCFIFYGILKAHVVLLNRGSAGFKSCKNLLDRVEKNDSSLVELVILPMKNFGDEDLKRLSEIIESGKNKKLKSISASGHRVSPESLFLLGKALASDNGRNITKVAIGDEHMMDEGVISFCRPLIEVNGGNIEELDLAYKNITKTGAKIIGEAFGGSKAMKRLELYRNPDMGDEGITDLCYAACTRSGSSLCFENIQYLDMSECQITGDGMKAFADCLTNGESSENVRSSALELQISKNDIGPEGCKHISKLLSNQDGRSSIISRLSMKKCVLGDEGFEILVNAFNEDCSRLLFIDISDNEIGAKGALHISEALTANSRNIKSLGEVILANNLLEEEGILKLAQSMRKEENAIHTLDLSGTKCGVNGALEILQCPTLKSIRLFNNNLSCDGFEAITPFFIGGHATIEHLDLGGNRAKESAVATLLHAIMMDVDSMESKLATLEIGGNEVGEIVEEILREMETTRPEIDVARDRPSVEQPNDFGEEKA